MPEGDTIFRAATTLRPVMEGGRIDDARIRDRQFEVERIVGRTVVGVEARGKHLLMHIESRVESRESTTGEDSLERVPAASPLPSPPLQGEGAGGNTPGQRPGLQASVLHSHMGMTGSWHVYHPGQAWLKPAHYASLWLSINNLEVICFSPKQLELLSADQFRRHPHLQRLGPDLLAESFDEGAAVARFRTRNELPIGEAVMNQTLVCGIGNIYKSEVLFLMHFDPFTAVSQFSDEELRDMLATARRLMQRNCGGPRRTTRVDNSGSLLWVYGQSGRPCPKCGTLIQLRRQGEAGRTTCWCPDCQPGR
jgi:endonuclease VIII